MTAQTPMTGMRPLFSHDGTLLAFIPRPAPIPPRQYPLYAQLILDGDIAQHKVPKLLDEEPEFARWYREHRGLPAEGRAA